MTNFACNCSDCTQRRNNRQGSERRQKTEMVIFRVTPGQHQLLAQMAEASGLSLAEWVRMTVRYWLGVEEIPEAHK